MANEPKATIIRADEGWREAIKKAAADEKRSVSAQVVKIVSDWLKERGYLS